MTHPEKSTILIRADAGGDLGSGHVMRMIALGKALMRRGISVTIASIQCPTSIAGHIHQAGLVHSFLREMPLGSAEDSRQTTQLAGELGCAWVILDGYHFGYEYQDAVREGGYHTAVMDDFQHLQQWSADLVINQNIGAEAFEYHNDAPEGRALCGATYALLREDFLHAESQDNGPSDALKLLITMGGVDPQNFTRILLSALEQIDDHPLEIKVIVGGGNPHKKELQQLAGASRHPVSLLDNVTDMPSLYNWSDRVISAGGSTCYEWLYFGKTAAVVELAKNQSTIVSALEERKLALCLGKADQLDAASTAVQLRNWVDTEIPEKETSAVDGRGADRIAAAIAGRFSITIASDKKSWINPYISKAVSSGAFGAHKVELVHNAEEGTSGDVLFLLSYWSIVPEEVLRKYSHSLVVHASDLPRGRGWSPVTWQIIKGQDEIPFCLLEAHGKVDSGPVFLRRTLTLRGNELLPEIQRQQAEMTMELCVSFVREYPFIAACAKPQSGKPSYFPRRGPENSELDPGKSLGEQFNLLRTVDNDRYPAFFKHKGRTFVLKIESHPEEKDPEECP